MQGVSWLAENRSASKEGLCCMEWVSKQVKLILYIIKMYCCATFIDDFMCDFKFVMFIIEVALRYMQHFLTIHTKRWTLKVRSIHAHETWLFLAYISVQSYYNEVPCTCCRRLQECSFINVWFKNIIRCFVTTAVLAVTLCTSMSAPQWHCALPFQHHSDTVHCHFSTTVTLCTAMSAPQWHCALPCQHHSDTVHCHVSTTVTLCTAISAPQWHCALPFQHQWHCALPFQHHSDTVHCHFSTTVTLCTAISASQWQCALPFQHHSDTVHCHFVASEVLHWQSQLLLFVDDRNSSQV